MVLGFMYEKIGNDGEKEGGRVGVDYVEIGEGEGKTEIFFCGWV